MENDILSKELLDICHQMSYGDDSDKTFDRYCELTNLKFESKEERQQYKDDLFD